MNAHEIERRSVERTLSRLARQRGGLGALGSDFATLNQIPEFQSAWTSVQAQLSSEGASALDVQSAADTLAKTYSDLTTGQFGVDTANALASATQFTIAAKTVAGSVEHVSGLIAAAQGIATPQQAIATFQMFTGTLIGLAATAGAFSAGVGALIVAGIGAFMDILQSAGLFGQPPAGQLVCAYPRVYCVNPDWVIGCVCAWGARVQPGAAKWRSFPPEGDPFWFGNPDKAGDVWNAATWGSGQTQTGGFQPTPVSARRIDTAYPDYFYLELEQQALTPAIADFQRAFFAAWKANKEFALNGLDPQPDWQVLLHLVRVWNRAHQAGTVYSLPAIARSPLTPPGGVYGAITLPAGLIPAGFALPPFEAMVVGDVLNNVAANDPTNYLVNGALQIHTGALLAPKKVVSIHVGTQAAAAASAALSTPAKVALATGGVAAAAAVGAGLVAWATHQAYGAVWSHFWDKTGGRLIRGAAR